MIRITQTDEASFIIELDELLRTTLSEITGNKTPEISSGMSCQKPSSRRSTTQTRSTTTFRSDAFPPNGRGE